MKRRGRWENEKAGWGHWDGGGTHERGGGDRLSSGVAPEPRPGDVKGDGCSNSRLLVSALRNSIAILLLLSDHVSHDSLQKQDAHRACPTPYNKRLSARPLSPAPAPFAVLVALDDPGFLAVVLFSVSSPIMFAQYSPLFTSGLLSECNTPSSSRRPSLEVRQKEPPESLPVDASIDSIYEHSISPSEDDAVFFTFMPRRRRVEVGNSFLSLDLAESQSMRSMSLRRKDTITTRATTHFGRSAPGSPVAAAVSYVVIVSFTV